MNIRTVVIGIVILVALVIFASSSGNFDNLLASILRFWPFLFIGAGLDLLLKEKVFRLPYLGLAAIAMILAGVLSAPFNKGPSVVTGSQIENVDVRTERNDGGLRTESFSDILAEAESASISLDLASAPTRLSALNNDDQLFEAIINDSGEFSFEAEGRGDRKLTFEKRSSRPLTNTRNVNWSFGLSPQIALELSVDAASGRTELDLSKLQLTSLKLDLGSGASNLSLPQNQQSYLTEIDGGSGSIEVIIPERADLELSADLGTGASRFTVGSKGYVVLELEGGSGSVTLDLDEDANVKLEVKDDGSGALNLPTWLRQQSGDRDKGVWQTESFRADAGQIIIQIDDRGSGSITVR